jgi:carbamoyl-phosphate synthase large subunit
LVNKVKDGGDHLVNHIKKGVYQLVVNTTYGQDVADSFSLRRAAIISRVPYFTTSAAFNAFSKSVIAFQEKPVITVVSIQQWAEHSVLV